MKDGILFGGVVFSLSWHLIWFYFLFPVLGRPAHKTYGGESVFLGRILKESDFSLKQGQRSGGEKRKVSFEDDLSRKGIFEEPAVLLAKPVVELSETEDQGHPVLVFDRTRESDVFVNSVSVGARDVATYFSNVDLSGLGRLTGADGLSTTIRLSLLLSASGEVQYVKKETGSGDPAVDFFIMGQFNKAVFKKRPNVETWLDLHLSFK